MKLKLPFAAAAAPAVSLFVWLAVASDPPEVRDELLDGGVEHVILIVVDGLRGDMLQNLLETTPEAYPAFVRLRNEGAFTFNARCDYDFSDTLPNHLSMITGRPVMLPAGAPPGTHHGFMANSIVPGQTVHNSGDNPGVYKASIFDLAHDNGLSTVFFHSKDRVSIADLSYNTASGAPDTTGPDNGVDKIDRATLSVFGSSASYYPITELLQDLETNPLAGFTMLHFVDPDKSGHATTWGSSDWLAAVAESDVSLGKLFAWLDAHPLEKASTTIILTSDHGGGTPVNHHYDATSVMNYTIPFMLWGPPFRGGTDAYTWFINRANPGTSRPAQSADTVQPLRNGDTANLAAGLLGLGTVPGSWFTPVMMDPAHQLEMLNIRPEGGSVRVSWPAGATAWQLETAGDPAGAWTPVAAGITVQEGANVFTAPEAARQFFRLRRI